MALLVLSVGLPHKLFAAIPAKNLLLPEREKFEIEPDRFAVAWERPEMGTDEVGVCDGRLVLMGVETNCAVLIGGL